MATKRQIEKASRIFGLALVAHLDCGRSYTGAAAAAALAVREQAIASARDKLHAIGFEPGDLLNEEDCLRAVGA